MPETAVWNITGVVIRDQSFQYIPPWSEYPHKINNSHVIILRRQFHNDESMFYILPSITFKFLELIIGEYGGLSNKFLIANHS